MEDLRSLASDLRAAGMALCVDLVLNHTAAEGRGSSASWRTRLLPLRVAGRTEPDAYERTLPDVYRHRARQLHGRSG